MKNFNGTVLNTVINAKGKSNGSINFYQWLKLCHQGRQDTLKEFYVKFSMML